MKSLRTILVLTVVGVMLAAPMAALAQPTIGVYFGPDKASSTRVSPFQEFKVWIILRNIEDTVNAVEWKLNLPAEVSVIDAGLYPGSVNVGNPADGYAVGLGECATVYSNIQPELVVAQMTVMALSEFAGTTVTISEYSGNEPTTAPRYSDCQGQLTDLTSMDGVLASSVGVESASWSAVKSLFD